MHWQGRVRKFIVGASKLGVDTGLRSLHYRKPRTKGWKFKIGSSGPLPDEFRGRWLNKAEVMSVWEYLNTVDHQLNAGGLGEWYDFHAFRG
jgi:hypothetical protein